MADAILQRMTAPGPKRILACDGGGILGLMSVEILARIEAEYRSATGRPDLVLADVFDFVCGTSTGAIIATCIALGMPVDQIRRFYLDSGPAMFERAALWKRFRYGYGDGNLAALLRRQINAALGDAADAPPVTLGDPRLRSLLMVVMRNHTTDSPWPLSNNPLAYYNDRNRPDCNLALPLWQLVRASTAAPTFFPPEVVVIGEGTAQRQEFLFVDGGVTTYNNPAFLAFTMATAAPYRVNWPTGPDRMLVVSVGTGHAPKARPDLAAGDLTLLHYAQNIPSALMNAACAGWDMTCRVLGECRFGGPIDREFGDGIAPPGGAPNWTAPKLFSYLRYDPDVTPAGLRALGLTDIDPAQVQVMDSVANIGAIRRVGEAFATAHVQARHFAGFL